MQLSAWFYRTFFAPTKGTVKVHLGPGQKNYFKGWINVDANLITARIDVWADLRGKLPFRDNSVDLFYSHHVIEHLEDGLLPNHFKEMFRCLKTHGVIRVGGPNGDSAAAKLLEGDAQWFSDFPSKRVSVGGRYANFILCRGEHLAILTNTYLTELAEEAGFRNVQFCQPATETCHPELIDVGSLGESESTPECPHTIIVEAEKDSRRSTTSTSESLLSEP